jgi:uncharacterized protein YgiM (DUF1202 family)
MTDLNIADELLERYTQGDRDLSGSDLREARLSEANLSRANLSKADLRGADLTNANLKGSNLRFAKLDNADLSGADLRIANLVLADLRNAYLQDASLRGSNLSWCKLNGSDLQNASFKQAILRGAELRGADLRGADLSMSDLSETDLRGANLDRASLQGAIYTDTTQFGEGFQPEQAGMRHESAVPMENSASTSSPPDEDRSQQWPIPTLPPHLISPANNQSPSSEQPTVVLPPFQQDEHDYSELPTSSPRMMGAILSGVGAIAAIGLAAAASYFLYPRFKTADANLALEKGLSAKTAGQYEQCLDHIRSISAQSPLYQRAQALKQDCLALHTSSNATPSNTQSNSTQSNSTQPNSTQPDNPSPARETNPNELANRGQRTPDSNLNFPSSSPSGDRPSNSLGSVANRDSSPTSGGSGSSPSRQNTPNVNPGAALQEGNGAGVAPTRSPARSTPPQAALPAPQAPTLPVTPSPNAPTSDRRGTVTWPQGLALRSGPSLNATTLGGVPANETALVLDTSPDGRWQYIRWERTGAEGWVKAGNIALQGETSDLPSVRTPTSPTASNSLRVPVNTPNRLTAGARGQVVWPEGLALRAAPSLQSTTIDGIAANETVNVLGTSPDGRWQRVRREATGSEGWVKSGNIAPLSRP